MMRNEEMKTMLIISASEWNELKMEIKRLGDAVAGLSTVERPGVGVKSPYITAKEFMAAVRICRSNFDKLVNRGKIMTLKKGRKVYVVASEVERYFREVEV